MNMPCSNTAALKQYEAEQDGFDEQAYAESLICEIERAIEAMGVIDAPKWQDILNEAIDHGDLDLSVLVDYVVEPESNRAQFERGKKLALASHVFRTIDTYGWTDLEALENSAGREVSLNE